MTESEVAGMVAAGESKGLVTRKEARRFLTERQLQRRIETGVLIEVFPRVYRVVGAPQTWMQSVQALHDWAKSGTLSHRTAAVLHGFKTFKEGPLDLTSARRLRVPEGVTVHRVDVMLRSDVTEVNELRVTKIPRTLIDLAAITDRYTLRSTFDQALREKMTKLDELEAASRRAKNRPGIIELRELLRELSGDGGPTDSELEDRCLDLISNSGLPKPKVQWSVVAGRKRRRLDLVLGKVVIEADGYASHSSIEVFEDDRLRNNSLVAGGLRVLHWTWQALNDRPEELIAELYASLNLSH